MPAPPLLASLPRPVLFGLYGTVAGLLAALTAGELVWYVLGPSQPPVAEAHTAPPSSAPLPQLAVTVSPRVSVYPGGTNTVAVRVARDRFDGPITVRFATPMPGLTGAEITIPAGETSGQTELTATATLKSGVYKLTATATADVQSLSANATIDVRVAPLPPPLPRLAVSVSPKIQAYQRGKNTFAVRVARGEFDGDVTVTFDNLPDGVTVPAVTIPAGQSEAKAELTAEGSAKAGGSTLAVTARASPNGSAISAGTTAAIDVLGSPKLPVDIAIALDCTGSMRKAVAGISASLPKFGGELVKSQFEAKFGLVGFQDTTLAQRLQTPLFNGERMTADLGELRGELNRLRLGGGGGEGESSLDGIAKAADSPFREPAVRVVLLITDGGPKKADGRIKSMDEAVKYLKDKKIDQLHVVALPEHRKPFEPLWAGAKGKYFDLKEALAADDFDRLMTDLVRAVSESIPERPGGKPAAPDAAREPVLPLIGSVKPPALPVGEEAGEPKIETPATAPARTAETLDIPPPEPKGRRVLAGVAWTIVVAGLACLALLLGQMTFLPGAMPSALVGAAGYGGGLAAGLALGAVGFFALDAVAGAFLGRLAGGSGLGLGVGLIVSLAAKVLRPETLEPDTLPLDPPPPKPASESLELEAEPLPPPAPVVTVPPVKPNIAPPKAGDGCPGCGRKIPGEVGKRYCMLCDNTF